MSAESSPIAVPSVDVFGPAEDPPDRRDPPIAFEEASPAAAPPPLGFSIVSMGPLQQLDGATAYLRSRFGAIVAITALLMAPAHVASRLLDRQTAGSLVELMSRQFGSGEQIDQYTLQVFTRMAASSAIRSLPYFLAGVVVGALFAAELRGLSLSTAKLLRRSARSFPAAIVAWLVTRLMIPLGYLAGGIGSVVLMLLLGVTGTAIGVERLGAFGGIKRSMKLQATNMGAALGATILTFGLYLLLQLPSAGIITWYANTTQTMPEWSWVPAALLSFLGDVVSTAIVACVGLTMYVTGRCRSEAWDLERRADEAFGLTA